MMSAETISIRRCHGLGNVVLLLPVLDYLYSKGIKVNLVTREEWISTFSTLRPKFSITVQGNTNTIDLDSLTADAFVTQHRIDEFAQLLGIQDSLSMSQIDVPASWQKPFEKLSDSIIFAPEAGHSSRKWSLENCLRIKSVFPNETLVLVGTERTPEINCDVDLRGKLDVDELFGILSVCKLVISMDSAVLHIAAAIKKPTVAIFGGVDYCYRLREDQPVVVLQSQIPCCPCNKNETCNEQYECMKTISVEDVKNAANYAVKNSSLCSFYLNKDAL